jgi:phosphohistidine phosphatase
MELLLVRHAIAFERDARRWPDDDERPLSPRGIERARQAAAGVKRFTRRPARVLVSPLLRTRQTAALLTRCAGWPEAVSCEALRPGTAPQKLLDHLPGSRPTRIALIGHEPDLSALLALCLDGGTRSAFALRKMGLALVEFSGPARAGHGVLTAFLAPRTLRAAR